MKVVLEGDFVEGAVNMLGLFWECLDGAFIKTYRVVFISY